MLSERGRRKELQPERPRAPQLAWRLRETSQVNHPPGQVDRTVKRRPQLAHAGRGARRRRRRQQRRRGAVNGRPAPLRCERGEDRNRRSPLPREPNAETCGGLVRPSSVFSALHVQVSPVVGGQRGSSVSRHVRLFLLHRL